MRDEIFTNACLYRDELTEEKVSKVAYNKRLARAKDGDKVKFLALQLGRYMAGVGYYEEG